MRCWVKTRVETFYSITIYHSFEDLNNFIPCRQGGTMVTYGGMSKKPVTVSTSAFIFKVRQ